MDTELLRQSIEANTSFTFARSGGKGGQNVNKVNTKVHGMIPVGGIAGLSPEERAQALHKLAARINDRHVLCIDVDEERTQEANRRIALRRLEDWIRNAAALQPKRKKTRPTAASKERRLAGKKIRSDIKKARRWSSQRPRDF